MGSSSQDFDRFNYPLYPHSFDDLVFMIFQRGKLKEEAPRSSAKPMLQWFIFVSITTLIMYALRKIIKRRERRLLHIMNNDAVPDYTLGSFVDSMGVFLGVALNRIGNCRAERWFLIAFSIFGLIFRTFYTDNLFVMFSALEQNRITTVDQLFEANIPISVDTNVAINSPQFYIRNRS